LPPPTVSPTLSLHDALPILVDDSGAQVPLARDPEIIDASGFTTELGSATSKDGTSIDYFLLRPKQVVEGAQPLLMTGYGAFGISDRKSTRLNSSHVKISYAV